MDERKEIYKSVDELSAVILEKRYFGTTNKV
jgi:hypothetical protein